MVRVGDTVVLMSAPGKFRVVAVKGHEVTIQNAEGLRKTVLDQAVRQVPETSPAAPVGDA